MTCKPASDRASALLEEVIALRAAVLTEGAALQSTWPERAGDTGFANSATNLAHYIALRHRDLRPLQHRLMTLGLSSLGRLESRVMPVLDSVVASLSAVAGRPIPPFPPEDSFFAGERLLAERTMAVLGPVSPRGTAVLVTCPSEAADDPAFIHGLAAAGVEALRINCAHDDADTWGRMIAHARAAEATTGRRLKILMDLGGPKIRTGQTRHPDDSSRVRFGVRFALVRPGALATLPADAPAYAAECQVPEAIDALRPAHRIFIDDAKAGAVVVEQAPWGVIAEINRGREQGIKLKPEKGLSFPDTDLIVSPLTAKDLADLTFVAAQADGISYSFVQSADDVALLQDELAQRQPAGWQRLSLVLKIETSRGLRNLPSMVVQAASRQPAAIMIARGDLAAEIGFVRTAEIQEEILWIAEAAQVPVIWATQVLESLVRKGVKVRGEMTDAAMAARAECVMLNKGPYVLEAVAQLDRLLTRMTQHQHKKTPQLRRLLTW